MLLVGALNPEVALPLIEKYLGGIPTATTPVPRKPKSVTALPFSFPQGVVTEEVRAPMIESINATQITFPVELVPAVDVGCMAEVHWVTLCTRVLETRLMQLLRFKYGEVYSVSVRSCTRCHVAHVQRCHQHRHLKNRCGALLVPLLKCSVLGYGLQVSAYFGAEAPSREGNWRGDVAVYFSCDPESAWRLRDLALEELERLQEAGPSESDVATVVHLEQRAHEVGQQENSYWLERIHAAYLSRKFEGNVDLAYTTRYAQELFTPTNTGRSSLH